MESFNCIPDFAPNDCFHIQKFKECMSLTTFSSEDDVKTVAGSWQELDFCVTKLNTLVLHTDNA